MGFLRKRDHYWTEEPEPQPVVGIKPGGALYFPEDEAVEAARQAEWQERADAKAAATRAMQEADAEHAREVTESMDAYLRAQMAVELPTHLRHRGLGDDD